MLCHGQNHPQVPVTSVTMMAVYCHNCAAWKLFYSAHTTTGEDDVRVLDLAEVEYGPFDSTVDVLQDAWSHWSDQLTSPGRPWDTEPFDPLGPLDP